EVSVVTPSQATAVLADEVRTGSLIFSQGDCLAVKAYSASRYTHVATVVVEDNGIYCYDSTAGIGVRKLPLAEYVQSQRQAVLHPYHPQTPFTPEQTRQVADHLDSQLGRPYGITHHMSGRRATGLHCAEYATDGLIACGILQAKAPARVSPASLAVGILKADLYAATDSLQLAPEPTPVPVDEGCCARLWRETCLCTGACYRQLLAWFCCK
ncbi:MAG: hypothetical protein JSS02_33040, partial [Planctomycetes bacterium]|nr:hypothetical protein [Planctomycetota bacterium]